MQLGNCFAQSTIVQSDGRQHAETVGCTAAVFPAEEAAQTCAPAPETFHLNNSRMPTWHAHAFLQ